MPPRITAQFYRMFHTRHWWDALDRHVEELSRQQQHPVLRPLWLIYAMHSEIQTGGIEQLVANWSPNDLRDLSASFKKMKSRPLIRWATTLLARTSISGVGAGGGAPQYSDCKWVLQLAMRRYMVENDVASLLQHDNSSVAAGGTIARPYAGLRKSTHNKQQIVRLIQAAQAGKPIKDICSEEGISEERFNSWKEKYSCACC